MKKEYNEKTESIKAEITALKSFLKNTDYKALKYSDGALTEEEYEPIREQRAEWRRKINEYENMLENNK